MLLAALLLLVRKLGEASDDTSSLQRCRKAVASIEASVAPVWRHRFEAHRAAFEHSLQRVDAAIALSQTLGPAEAIGRAVAHAELFEAVPCSVVHCRRAKAFWPFDRILGKQGSSTSRGSKNCMGDADEFVLLAERYEGLPVLKPDRARGAEARYADADKLSKKMRWSASHPRFGMNLSYASPHHVVS